MKWSEDFGECANCGVESDLFNGLCWDCYDEHWAIKAYR